MTAATPVRTGLGPAVDEALGSVRDPELDEAITDLGFVAGVDIAPGGGAPGGAEVRVQLRLPTYFCAPNFAYLMVADAHDAVSAVPGVGSVTVQLLDHFASEEINGGVAAAAGFTGSFPGLADGDLAELRRTFRRKAHDAAQEAVAASLLDPGQDPAQLLALRLGDAPESPLLDRLRRRRADLGLPTGPDAPLLLSSDGSAMPAEQLPLRLRLARTTRVSIEGNGLLCRGLLATRYGEPAPPPSSS
jgi:metal-sulfur cluster biosynthetic enzyme